MSPPEAPARRRRWLRILLRVGVWGGLALLLAVGFLVWAVLFTEAGTRRALTWGVEWYDSQVAGQVEVARIEGTLASGLTLHGVRLANRAGEPLVTLDRLATQWRPGLLLDEAVRVPEVTVEGLVVHLREGPDPFGDLKPPGEPPPPPPPPEGLGPDLPLGIHARVDLDGVRVVQHGPAGEAVLLDGLRLSVDAEGRGRRARVDLWRLAADVRAAELRVDGAGLHVAWTEPRVALRDTWIATDQGRVRIPDVAADLAELLGHLELGASPAEAVARRFLPPPLDVPPAVSLAFAGGLGGLDLQLGARWPEGPDVALHLRGAVQPAPDLTLDWRLRSGPLARFAEARSAPAVQGSVDLEGQVRVRAPPTPLDRLGTLTPADLEVGATVRCVSCEVAPAGAVSLAVGAALRGGTGRLAVQVRGLDAEIDLEAGIEDVARPDEAALFAEWRVAAPRLARTLAAAGVRDVAGAVRTRGRCRGSLGALQCSGEVDAGAVAAGPARVASAKVAFEASPLAEPLAFSARVTVGGARVEGLPGTTELQATVRGTPQAVDLDLSVSRSTGERLATALRAEPGPPARVRLDRLAGRAEGIDFRTAGTARLVLDPARIQVDGLRLGLLGGTIAVDGAFAPAGRSDLAVRVTDLDLAALPAALKPPPVAGRVGVDLKLRGPPAAPDLRVAVTGRALAFEGRPVGDLDVRASHAGGRVQATVDLRTTGPTLHVEAEAPVAVRLDGPPRWNEHGPHRAVWRLDGADTAWARAWAPIPGDLEAGLSTAGTFAGTPAAPRLDGTVEGRAVLPELGDTPFSVKLAVAAREQSVQIAVAPREMEPIRIEADTRADLAALQRGADPLGTPFDVRVEVPGLPLQRLGALLPPDLGGRIAASLHARGTAAAPVVDANVEGRLSLPKLGDAPFSVKVTANATEQSVRISAAPAATPQPLTVEVDARADLAALQRGADPLATPFEARVEVPALPLQPFAAFLPDTLDGLEGLLTASIQARGTPAAPVAAGRVDLAGGAVTVVNLDHRVHDITLLLTFEDRAARLAGFSFRAGDGEGHVTGEAAVGADGALAAKSTLQLRRYGVAAPGAPPLEVDTRVDVTARHGAGPTEVDVEVRGTRVRLLEETVSRAPRPVPTSEDIVFTDEPVVPSAVASAAATAAAAPAEAPLRLTVQLVDPVEIRGPSIDMRWGGRIDVRQADARRSVAGALNAVDGSFNLLGNRFVLDTGEVTLPEDGGAPYLLVIAAADTPEARVTATIRGAATAPELNLSSEPPMPQFQILSLLVTGTTEPAEGANQDLQYAAAGMLASFKNPALERQLQDRVGIDRVELTFGENIDQPILRVGKRLSQRLYIESRYHHNAPPDTNTTEGIAQLLLDRRLALETRYGDAGIGAVELLWRTRFGGVASAAQ